MNAELWGEDDMFVLCLLPSWEPSLLKGHQRHKEHNKGGKPRSLSSWMMKSPSSSDQNGGNDVAWWSDHPPDITLYCHTLAHDKPSSVQSVSQTHKLGIWPHSGPHTSCQGGIQTLKATKEPRGLNQPYLHLPTGGGRRFICAKKQTFLIHDGDREALLVSLLSAFVCTTGSRHVKAITAVIWGRCDVVHWRDCNSCSWYLLPQTKKTPKKQVKFVRENTENANISANRNLHEQLRWSYRLAEAQTDRSPHDNRIHTWTLRFTVGLVKNVELIVT